MGNILKNIQKTSANEGENEKIYHIYTAWMELGLDMVTNILNIKYKMYNDSYIH